ncbi:MAG: class II aldolase/adducin family protein [Oligoflexales bacterium]
MTYHPRGLAQVYVRQMVDVAHAAWLRGWAAGTAGNFSVASPHGVWMSPSGVCKGKLSTERFILIDSQLGVPLRHGSWKASEEAPAHLGIYQHMGLRGCVVHVHPPILVEKSRGISEWVFQADELQKALGCDEASEILKLKLAPNPKRHDFKDLQNQLTEWWCEKAKLLIVQGHGVWAWGETPQAAMNRIEAIEHLCNVNT